MTNRIITTEFYGNELYCFLMGGVVYVALKPIVEGMGLDWSAQFRRVQRDEILNEGVAMMAMPFRQGGRQESACLRLDLLHGWLFTVDSSRIKVSATKQKVILYQRECYNVLYKRFSEGNDKLAQQEHESESLRLRMVAEARQVYGVRAAAQLWEKLKLPIVPAMAETLVQHDLFEDLQYRAA